MEGIVNYQTQGRINVIGERIRQARLAASFTQDEVVSGLAEAGHGITKAALSKYENKKSQPRQALLLALARVLGVKPAYFLAEPDLKIKWLAFRKQTRLPKTKQQQIKAFVSNVLEGQVWLQGTLFPNAKPLFPGRVRVTGPGSAEKAAMKLRKTWKLGDSPIDSVITTVEDKGGYVVGVPNPGIKFDGLSGRVDGRPLIVVNVDTDTSVDRRRFNVAHELGHLQMNCEQLSQKEAEKLAHRFAAALLVPEAVAREELGSQRRHLSLGELGVLKRKHGLSIQAWARRAKDLKIISENEYKTLCIEISRRGWRKREPEEFDFKGHELPTRLKQMTLRALSEGIISQQQAERICKGSTEGVSTVVEKLEGTRRSPRELLRLPKEERARILAAAATRAEKEYRTNADLTDFEAYGEDDLYVESTETATR